MTLKHLTQGWGFFSLKISLFACNIARAGAASNFCLSIFGHKIGVLKFPALFQGKELQVTHVQASRLCASDNKTLVINITIVG